MNFTKEQKKLLLDLFHLYGPSYNEEPILKFIKNVLSNNDIPFREDSNGNIFCLNYKNGPLLSAHTDCVGSLESGSYVNLIDIYPYRDDEILKGIGNIGGDDKCGVFLILLCLLNKKPINAIFTICEEIGGVAGIDNLLKEIKDNEIFKSCPYCLVLDRRNNGDIICNKNKYGSKEFEDALYEIGVDFGYSPTTGLSCDMNKIKEYMNGCNLSVGYYNPHSSTEFVSLNDLYNTWLYINELIEKMPKNFELENNNNNNNYYNNYNYYNNNNYNSNDYYYNNYKNSYNNNKKSYNCWDDYFYDD